MNLDALFNNILTSGIKLADPETSRKIRILNLFHLVFIMAAPLLGLFFFYVGAIRLFYAAIAAGLFMVSSLLLLRRLKDLLRCGNYAIFIFWVTLFVIAWNTGAITYDGVITPSWILNAGLILFAIFLNGYLWGTVWSVVVFVQTGVVIYLFRAGYLFPNLIPPEIGPLYYLGTFMVALLATLLFAFLFEKEKEDALIRERGKSEALRESKRYIDDILERSPVPTFILDRNHRVIQWNHACRDLTGIAASDVLGKEVWEGFHVDERGSMADILLGDPSSISESSEETASRTESGWYEMEMFLPGVKGGIRAVITAAPIMDAGGAIRGAIQTVQEIRAPAVGTGLLSNELLSQAGESATIPVFKVDSQAKITFWNHACESVFGFRSEEMLGRSAMNLISKRYRSLFKDTILKAFKGEPFSDKAWKCYTSKEKPVYVLVRGYVFDGAEGGGKECVIISSNITDLRMRMKKLELYAAESKEKLKSLSEEYDLLKKNIATFIRKKDDGSS
ncbi:MAG: PAS domain-containing protein [Deltaproteobacteria bacterium]|nr:PAS domain-containing protein [Deltaproteobacteria bacterium]